MDSKVIIYLLTSVFFLNCFHDNCVRSYIGKIDYKSGPQSVFIIISKHSYSYSVWDNPDTLKISSKDNCYKLSIAEQRPQQTCNNNCPNRTMSDSIRVKILNSSDKQVLKDTVFSCEDYNFNGDDIELPTISLP